MRLLLAAVLALGAHLASALPAAAQPAPPEAPRYRLYTREGAPAALADLEAALAEARIVLVGEQHDDPVAHELELLLLQTLHAQRSAPRGRRRAPNLALSLEMFERDVQPVLNEYLAGLITEPHFLAAARPWGNYATDYRPLVEYAREHGLPVIAANAPRRYVNLVSRRGRAALTDLPAEARLWLPPLPYAAPSAAYRARWEGLMGGMSAHADTAAAAPAMPPEASARMLDAQGLWDASMAYAAARYLRNNRSGAVLHLAGAFHVERGSGIADHLRRYAPRARVLAVVIRPADLAAAFPPELRGLADFIFLTDAALPRSYAAP